MKAIENGGEMKWRKLAAKENNQRMAAAASGMA